MIDLHMHTNHSDGTDSVEELLKNANNKNIELISITDIDGMECIYTLFSEKERNIAFELCKKYNKYMSGGTDYHAKNKPDIELGTGKNNNINIEYEVVKEWAENIRKI